MERETCGEFISRKSPKPLVIKFAIFVLALSLLGFMPREFAVIIHAILFILLCSIAIIAILAVYQDLNLLHLPVWSNWKSENGSGTTRFRRVSYNGLDVYYTKNLNGGGLGLSHEFVRLISTNIGKVEHIYEYCAGPGFIGFNLLANNLCNKLTLSDVNPKAIEAINETIKRNGLEDRVMVYQSDCLDSIAENEAWDLVVSNPPWQIKNTNKKNLILCDPGARVHERFF